MGESGQRLPRSRLGTVHLASTKSQMGRTAVALDAGLGQHELMTMEFSLRALSDSGRRIPGKSSPGSPNHQLHAILPQQMPCGLLKPEKTRAPIYVSEESLTTHEAKIFHAGEGAAFVSLREREEGSPAAACISWVSKIKRLRWDSNRRRGYEEPSRPLRYA